VTARPVDLAAVRAGLDRLSSILIAHPEAAERTAAYLDGDSVPFHTGDSAMSDLPDTVPVKIPADLLARADSLLAAVAARPSTIGYGRVSRSAVIRVALARGLDAMAAELTPPAPVAVAAEVAPKPGKGRK
jgi:hypothetical protein